jgi:hypothetical protein
MFRCAATFRQPDSIFEDPGEGVQNFFTCPRFCGRDTCAAQLSPAGLVALLERVPRLDRLTAGVADHVKHRRLERSQRREVVAGGTAYLIRMWLPLRPLQRASSSAERRPRSSKFCVARESREWDHVANILHARHVHEEPLEAETEPRVRHGAEFPQFEVPPIALLRELHLTDAV